MKNPDTQMALGRINIALATLSTSKGALRANRPVEAYEDVQTAMKHLAEAKILLGEK
jgi:hypothetical protein